MSVPEDSDPSQQHECRLRGTLINFHGLNTYAVEPPNGRQAKGIIIIIPDALGLESMNNKLLADAYATKGDYQVYLPDFMLGHSCPSWFFDTLKEFMSPGNYLMKPYHVMWAIYAFVPWLYHNSHRHTFPTVKAFFYALRSDEGPSLPVAVAGFSWGGKHTILLTHPENYVSLNGVSKPTLDAAFIGHPISVDVPSDFEKMTVPASIAIPEGDHHVKAPTDTDLIGKIMDSKPFAQRGDIKVYAGCAHGFCTRRDFSTPGSVEKQASEAEDQAIAWFNSKLGIDPLL